MHIEDENGIITLMRGDSLVLPIKINDGTKLEPRYRPLKSSERLYVGVMRPNQAFEDAVLKKTYNSESPTDDEGNVLFMLAPEDTIRLLTGKYYYMVKLRTVDKYGVDFVKTVVSPTLFWLEGNNPVPDTVDYWEKGKYDIDTVIFEGSEITNVSTIVYDGGEIQ